MMWQDTVSKFLVGTGVLIGIFLIITNPAGDKTLLDSGSSAYVSGVKALQGR